SSGNPTSWEWTFEGGTPSTSSSPNPEVTYENAGSYDVSLTVTNNNGMDTKAVEDYITVNVLEPVYFDFEGGNPADPVYTIYLSGGVLQGEDLQPGDEIAIFDGETMVGAMMLDGVLTPETQFDHALIAFSTVTSGNGYTPGNPMTLKCYDASEEIESTGFEIEFYDPYGDAWTESYFPEGDGAYSIAGLTFTAGATQQMSLGAGYQFVSSYMIPPDPDMMTLCEDLMYDETLDFIRNSEGSMLQKIGPNWVNNIGDWNTLEGYLFKMNTDDMLEMGGSIMDPQTPMTLEAGYQFISYLPETPIDALVAMETVLENLDFVRNSTGNMLQKIGPNWVNNIGNMNPGEGYLVRMNADDELIYPEATKSYQPASNAQPQYFEFNGGNPADPVYTIFIEAGNLLQAGDEVAAFDGDKLVGSMIIESSKALENDLPVFATINEKAGYTPGNELILKAYDKDKQEEIVLNYTMVNEYQGSRPGNTYPEKDGKFGVVQITNEETFAMDIFPNPFSEEISVATTHSGASLQVFNSTGKLILEKVLENDQTIETGSWESGIYLLCLTSKDGEITTKKVIKR
ncbi:MAG: T9SS type A sorting domain-containing protein, partial [Bacteroidales bacterium]|nr:T9SS type A sorting domain-containing protein [Bacteroidales bacterium]